MRIIEAAKVTEVVRRLCIEANCHLTQDLKDCIVGCRACEPFPVAQNILDQVIEGNTKVLMSSLPDQEALRNELGYRAENVAGLAD